MLHSFGQHVQCYATSVLDDVAIVWPDLYTENEHEVSLNRKMWPWLIHGAVRTYFQTMFKTLFAVFGRIISWSNLRFIRDESIVVFIYFWPMLFHLPRKGNCHSCTQLFGPWTPSFEASLSWLEQFLGKILPSFQNVAKCGVKWEFANEAKTRLHVKIPISFFATFVLGGFFSVTQGWVVPSFSRAKKIIDILRC